MKKILTLLITPIILFSCHSKDPVEQGPVNRTVLVYIVADNNLYSHAIQDIKELERAWTDSYDGTVLVFLNPRGTTNTSKLYKIKRSAGSAIESEIIKDYGVSVNACDYKVLQSVIADTRQLAPALSYGLVLWSHGTGWVPEGMPPMKSQSNNRPNIVDIDLSVNQKDGPDYSFGNNDTYNDEMDIGALAMAFPNDIKMDFVMFDACYMAGIEVCYELRNKTNYVISSASETLAEGFRYDQILPDMMSKQANVNGITKKTVEYFDAYTGWFRSCTMSTVDCSKLPALAAVMKEIVTGTETPNLPELTTIQKFAVNDGFRHRELFYDFGDFVNKTWSNSPLLSKFNAALNDAVAYKGNTSLLYNELEVLTHCGVTVHIPLAKYPIALTRYKDMFDWSTDSGLGQLSL